MVRNKAKASPEVFRKDCIETLKKLNVNGRGRAVSTLRDMGVDTSTMDAPYALVSQDVHEQLFDAARDFFGAWERMLTGDKANEAWTKLWEQIHDNSDFWRDGYGPA